MKQSKGTASVSIVKYWLLIFTVLVCVAFTIATPRFATLNNLLNILGATCSMAIAGMGLTCIMATGEIDFSAGKQVSMGGILFGVLLSSPKFNSVPLAIILVVLIMMCYGAFNAFLHIVLKMPAFIATMGSSYLLLYLSKALTNGGVTILRHRHWPDAYNLIGQGRLFGVIPNTMLVLIIVSIIMFLYTERTRWGKYLYAVGANPRTCDYLGISSAEQKLRGFLLCSALSALAGIVTTSMLMTVTYNMGEASMLESMTIIMLGATFGKVGVYNIPGTIIAAFLLNAIFYGMTMLGAAQYMKDLVQGVILLAAIAGVTIIRAQSIKRIR